MFVVLNEALESVEKKRMKINDLENQVSEAKHAGNTSKNVSWIITRLTDFTPLRPSPRPCTNFTNISSTNPFFHVGAVAGL